HNYMDVIVFLYGTLKRKVVSINPSAITKNNKKSSPVHSHWLYVKLQVIPLELRTIYLSLDRTGISQSKSFNSNLLKYENQLHRRPSKFFFSNQFFPIFSSTVY
ncbi:IS5/IS1182 family transposase, partial [Enterococcus faecium]